MRHRKTGKKAEVVEEFRRSADGELMYRLRYVRYDGCRNTIVGMARNYVVPTEEGKASLLPGHRLPGSGAGSAGLVLQEDGDQVSRAQDHGMAHCGETNPTF